MIRRYRYRVEAGPAAEQALNRIFGGCRHVHNAYIAAAREAYASGSPHPSESEASKLLITQGRANPDTAWLKELPTIALRGALRDAAQAYENFFASHAGTRKGAKMGHPRFKRRHARQAARFYEAGFSIRGGWQNTQRGGGRLYLAKVGLVSVNWDRPLPSSPSSVTVIKEADGTWWASFVVTVPVSEPAPPAHPDRAAGIDLGLKDLVTVAYSDGTREKVAAPKYYRTAERKLGRAQKKLARARRGSKNREKLRTHVARIHSRTANLRRDFARQLVARLIRENQTIALETLNITGMVRSRYAKSIHDAGWGLLVRELETHAALHGRTVVRADRFFASTRTCAICETKSGPTTPDVREWTCTCGATLDRDYNAATNLMVRALAPGKAERLNACGRDIRLRLAGAVSDEAGTHRNEVAA
ncbi:transposase [Microbacterium sp. NPDC096154]|uniref:RNA-guided endonuclease InsQ/TnpB family protein n=1 Tax=Microbacterium sp. NPDC096154 TaxID=3155549 RepID=UPI00332F2C77